MRTKFNVIDLFGAPGGLALGFLMTGRYRILACLDSDEAAATTYRANFSKVEVIVDLIENIDAKNLLDVAKAKTSEIDLVIGGPPCPGFSLIGRVKMASLVRSGKWNHLKNSNSRFIDDPRNVLYKHFVRIVGDLKPKFFVMENVSGMVSHNNGETVKQVIEDFGMINYNTEWRVLNAVGYGAPQERKRIFFIGNRLGISNPFPAPTHRLHAKGFNGEKLEEAPTVWDAIGDLPRLRQGDGKERSSYTREPFTDYQRWARRGNIHVFNHIARHHGKRDLTLFGHMREGAKWKDMPLQLRKMYGYRDDVFDDKIKRLLRKRPSWTITAHMAKDGYMYIHPTQDRSITVREAARLQTFPDNFIFSGTRTSQFRQVGNAVPPLLARAVAAEIYRVLDGL